eukprot:GGOE01013569.1.p1 GENE.GGOE01013569.1~~GGOE01013569.1.p1  ORF type:complete len:358 (-),score=31.04 GGOE01013569.1:348-1370(-)
MSYYGGPYSGGYPGRTWGSPFPSSYAPYSPYSPGYCSGCGTPPYRPPPSYGSYGSYFRPSAPYYSPYNSYQSGYSRPLSYSTPLPAYAPPVAATSYPTTTYSNYPATSTSFLRAPATSYGLPPVTSTLPYSAPQYTSSYGNYLASAPVSFAARSYGEYSPYSPAGSYFPTTFPTTTFSAYGGYRGLEQPLDMPVLALPAPATFVGSSPITLPAPASTLPGFFPPVPFAAGSAFPYAGAVPLPSFDSTVVSPATPEVPLMAIPGAQVIDVAPEDVPTAAEGEQPVEVEQKEEEEEQQEEVRVELVEPEQKAPWAAVGTEEDFDLEYSRQVAARKVIGEEEE